MNSWRCLSVWQPTADFLSTSLLFALRFRQVEHQFDPTSGKRLSQDMQEINC